MALLNNGSKSFKIEKVVTVISTADSLTPEAFTNFSLMTHHALDRFRHR